MEAESSGGDELRQKFTGHERDDRVGLDYMMARSCRMALGRFLEPDEHGGSARSELPQSWNRYAYVSNNPINAFDPTGYEQQLVKSDGDNGPNSSHGDLTVAQNAGKQPDNAPPQQTPPEVSKTYSTPEAAAAAALKNCNQTSIRENKEYAGLIYRNPDGTYQYTGPVPGTVRGSDGNKAPAPKGTTVVGDYHTHGDYSQLSGNGQIIRTGNAHRDDGNSDHFSTPDKQRIADATARSPDYRGYLGTPSGRFLTYDPKNGELELK